MSKQKIKVVQRAAKPYILHEYNEKNQHRLVLVLEDGNKVSRWFEGHQIGSFEGLLFASYNGPLKPGVFRQQMVEARFLPEGANRLEGAQADSPKAAMDRALGANRSR